MPFNQLLLVLIGGFIFVSQWRRTKYYTRRVDGHRLLLFSACAGVVFLLIAVLIDAAAAKRYPGIVEFWGRHISYPHTGKTFIAFILGSTLWYPLNYFHSEYTHVERVLLKLGGPFEILLANAMSRRQLLMLKVKNDNIYVGYVNRNFNPTINPASLEMTLVMRGYADKDTKEEVFDRFYLTTDQLKMNPLPFETLTVALPVSEVESAHLFDATEYARRFEQFGSVLTDERRRERPTYDNFGAQDHFQLAQQYLLEGELEIAGQQFIQAGLKDWNNADYRFFLALVRSLEIVSGNKYYRVIPYAADMAFFAWYVQLAKSYAARSDDFEHFTMDEVQPLDLDYLETATVFELLVHALVGDPAKYKGAVQFILDATEKAQNKPKNGLLLRTENQPFTNQEMNDIETEAKQSLINVIYTCLQITGNDPRYYQFVALALAATDRVVEIDLLAEALIQKDEWEAAEAVYSLPLKHNENEHLRASLGRIKQRQFPLKQI